MEQCPHPVEQLVVDHGDFTHRHAMFTVTLILRCLQCGLEWAPQTHGWYVKPLPPVRREAEAGE